MNNPLIKLFVVVISYCVFTSTGFAGSPYVSGQIGRFGSGDVDPDTTIDHGMAARIAAGYTWDTTKRIKLGLETGLTGFQTTHVKTYFANDPINSFDVDLSRTNVDILGVFDLFVTKRFDLFAKLGWAYQTQKVSSRTSMVTDITPARDNGNGLKLALGLGYNITPQVNLNLEVSGQSGGDGPYLNDHVHGIGTTMLGLRYKFDAEKQPVQTEA